MCSDSIFCFENSARHFILKIFSSNFGEDWWNIIKNTDFKKKVEGEKQVTKKAKISVAIFLVSMVVIAICGIFPALRPTFSDGTQLAMTSLIQIIMYVAAAIIVIVRLIVTTF